MKNIALFVFLFCSVSAFSQISVNTNFAVNGNLPIDARDTLTTLADTAGVTWTYPGLLSYAVDVDQFWYYTGSFWKQFVGGSAAIDTSTVISTQYQLDTASQAIRDELATRTGIDTLWSYTALRAYTGTSKTVIVKDWTYTGPDSNTYTTVGGLFYRVPTGTENGGTLIAATNGVKWQRQWDGINVRPEWWVCGGYGALGNVFVSKNVSTNSNGDITGIYSEADRVHAANVIAQNINGKVVLQRRTYMIDRKIEITNLDGNGGKLKLYNPSQTTLASSHTAGDNTFVVTDASGFRCGQQITATLSATTYGGIGEFEDIGKVTITGISGDTITFSGTTTDNAPSGSKVGALFAIAFMNVPCTIVNTNFDGNWDKVNHINYDWTTNDLLTSNFLFEDYTGQRGVTMNNVKFENVPGTAIRCTHLKLDNFTARNIGGGLFHHGNDGGADKTPSYRNYMIVSNGAIDSVGIIGRQLNSHEEALFTFSGFTKYTLVTNVKATNIAGLVFGDVGAGLAASESDGTVEISNCSFEGLYTSDHTSTNPKETARFTVAGNITPDSLAHYKISNCVFVNTGDIFIQGVNTANGYVFSNISFSDCDFTNVRVSAVYVSNISFDKCKFYHKPNLKSFTDFSYYTKANALDRSAFISILWGDQVSVTNCKIEGSPSYNQYADYGILLEQDRFAIRKDSTGALTKLYYGSYLIVDNNEVAGVSFGIGNIARPNDASSQYNNPCVDNITIGSRIANNKIRLEKYADYNLGATKFIWGIHSIPGVEVTNNEIVFPETTPANAVPYGILCPGFTLAAKDTLYQGSIVRNNRIISGSSTSNDIRVSTTSGTSLYNNILISNITDGNIIGATNSIQQGNIKIFENISIPGPYKIPDENYLLKNKYKY